MLQRALRPRRRALAAYVAAWLVAASAVATLVILALGGGEPDAVTLPPVEETALERAAFAAGCELRRARPRQQLNPPVSGPPSARAARGGFYEDAPEQDALVSALRRGVIVIQFRTDVDQDRLDELRALQEALPAGTIVTPNATGMPYEVAVTAYRRLLGCGHLTDASLDAVQLFRGRYVGSGPDA
jgi:hypothetical protein